METDFSGILCVADMNITGALDQCLTDLGIPEVFIQPAKQISLVDRQGFLGLRRRTTAEENRALLYRFYVPSVYGEGLMRRVAEATDLKMGGRGSIFSQNVTFHRRTSLAFDMEKLDRLCGKSGKPQSEEHVLISCTVPRGGADSLAQAILELGVCVPVIFFGSGVGFRDKLGLMRITIPAEKEIIWFVVPRSDTELIEKTLIPRARLDVPGQGFLYKILVRAPVVNLRVRQGKRVHAATMDQVIAAMDEIRGSSDWRRLGSRRYEPAEGKNKAVKTRGLNFIGEEDEVDLFRKTAMENGARGATLNSVEMRSYGGLVQEHSMESNSRKLCDIILPRTAEEKLLRALPETGLFDSEKTCFLKAFDVEMPDTVRVRYVSPGEE